jgi:hypothetical protein
MGDGRDGRTTQNQKTVHTHQEELHSYRLVDDPMLAYGTTDRLMCLHSHNKEHINTEKDNSYMMLERMTRERPTPARLVRRI